MVAGTPLRQRVARWAGEAVRRLRRAGRDVRLGGRSSAGGRGPGLARLVPALLLAAGIAAGYFTGSILVTLAAPGKLGWSSRPEMVGTLPPGQVPESRSALTGIDVFHRPDDESGQSGRQERTAEETTLDLKLTGLRTPGSNSPGSAIIRKPDHGQRAYRPGEEILPNVTLRAVREASVLLEREGALETLYLSERARRRAGAQGDPESAQTAPAEAKLDRLLGAVDIRPRLENGRMTGLRITGSSSETRLQKNRLKRGDVLVAVNGIEITSPDRAEAALKALRGASRARVVIERDGRERTISLALDG